MPLLYNLTERQLWQLARAMGETRYKKGDTVFRQGELGDTFFIVRDGGFKCTNEQGVELARVGPGGCFGELALLRREPRAASVVALSDSQVLTLSREAFVSQLGHLAELRTVWRVEALRRVPLLRELPPDTLTKMAECMTATTVGVGHDIIKQGQEGDCFYVVEHGKLGAFVGSGQQAQAQQRPSSGSPKPSMVYGPGQYFGELALLKKEPRAATVGGGTAAAAAAAAVINVIHVKCMPMLCYAMSNACVSSTGCCWLDG